MKKFAICKLRSLGAATLLFFLFQACVHVPPKKVTPCNRNPKVYQRALLDLSHAYRSLSGKVRVRVETPEGRFSFIGDLYARSPDKLHFDIFGFLHRPRFLLIKNGSLIAWKDFDSGGHYTGPLDKCPPFPVKFPFSPLFLKDFMKILFLNFPPPLKVLQTRQPGNSCRFLLTCGWGKFDMILNPLCSLPSEIVGPKGDRTPFRLTFSEYSGKDDLMVPHHYVIAVEEVKMEVTFKSLEVNPKIPDESFSEGSIN